MKEIQYVKSAQFRKRDMFHFLLFASKLYRHIQDKDEYQ